MINGLEVCHNDGSSWKYGSRKKNIEKRIDKCEQMFYSSKNRTFVPCEKEILIWTRMRN